MSAPAAALKKKDLMKDLRNTHFELGHDGRGDFKSVYIKDYPEWPLEGNKQTIDNNLLRKTHFVAGVDDMDRRFRSIYKEDYIGHPQNMSQLNEENQKDLRTHHFKYGFDSQPGSEKISEHHAEYIKKQVPDVDRENQKLMKKIVSSSTKIWDDQDRYMKSMYKESYPTPEADGQPRHTKNDIQKQLIQLRSSNILMGNNNPDYTSIFMEDYYNKGVQAYQKTPPPYDLKATHYKIGDSAPVYQSSHRVDFDWKDPEIAGDQNKALAKDLRGKQFF